MIGTLKTGKVYEPLYKAAVARAQSDWIVGINATRALTCKYNAQLSCGLQTPTLAMIAAREEEIKNFTPQPYYGMKAIANGITFTWINSHTNTNRTPNKEHIQKLCQHAADRLTVTDVHKKAKKSFSPHFMT